MNRLVLFTINYPYGKGEAFIESEIPVLARKFDAIYILPSSKVEGKRRLPENVYLIDDLTSRDNTVAFKNIVSLFNKLFFLFLFTLVKSPFRLNYLKFWKSFLGFAVDDLSKQDLLIEIIRANGLSDAIFYDYWFVNSTITISNLKRKGIINKAIARCHRFDLYDEELYEGVVSFREYKINYLDKVFPISLHGKKYLINQLSEKYHRKIELFYLGVDPPIDQIDEKKGVIHRIVSCSRVVGHKNVSEIVEVLSKIDLKIHWVHFGSGPLLENVKNKSKELLPSNIEYELMGEVSNSEIIRYYSHNNVDLFLSLSQSEGLPVSIMEVLMFGIPIVAKSVCGIPEVVVDGCGCLMDVKCTTTEIADTITGALAHDFDKDYIKKVTNEKFNGDKNFTHFSDFIIKTFKDY